MSITKDTYIAALSVMASQNALYDFIRLIDLAHASESKDYAALSKQIIARGTIVLGNRVIESWPVTTSAIATIEAAEYYLLDLNNASWATLYRAATMSYPLGPGEGCFSIEALKTEKSCAAGSGCRSAAGSFASLGLDDVLSFNLLQSAILPWLCGEYDPLFDTNKT